MYLHVGTNESGMPDPQFLPQYEIADGFSLTVGDVLGRKRPDSLFEHQVLVAFNGAVLHSPGPGEVFRWGTLDEVLEPGGRLRIVYPTRSGDETFRRLARAQQILGVPWWNMHCQQTMEFVVGQRNFWLA
jgi:hypothetical protein